MDIEKIVKYILSNKVSSTELADSLEKKGWLKSVNALNRHCYAVGIVRHIIVDVPSNYEVYKKFEDIKEGDILYIECRFDENKAIFGDIACKYLFTYKRIAGLVVKGRLRDANRLVKEGYAIWCSGVSPIGVINTEIISNFSHGSLSGGIAVCDDSGVVIAEPGEVNKKLIKSLERIELLEDCWYYCVDTLKWSPYETISLRKYLKDPGSLPERLLNLIGKSND